MPLDWAMAQNNLGNALLRLGELGDDAALRRAVQAYEAALQEFTRERAPLQWAHTQHTLADALATLAERGKDAVHAMEEAVVRMRGAAQAYQQVGESHWLPRAQRRAAELEAELARLKR